MTLVELLVVLTLLGLLAARSAPALTALGPARGTADRWARARAEAIRTGQPVALRDSAGRAARFLPDGQVVRGVGTSLDGRLDAAR